MCLVRVVRWTYRSRALIADCGVGSDQRTVVLDQRLMSVRGISPVIALAYRTAVDVPQGLSKLRQVAVHFGLTLGSMPPARLSITHISGRAV